MTLAVAGAKAPLRPRGSSRRWWPSTVGFLLPAVGLITIFVLLPMLMTIWLSFQSWRTPQGFGQAKSVGLQNFSTLFSDTVRGRDFRQALRNTGIYALAMVVITIGRERLWQASTRASKRFMPASRARIA